MLKSALRHMQVRYNILCRTFICLSETLPLAKNNTHHWFYKKCHDFDAYLPYLVKAKLSSGYMPNCSWNSLRKGYSNEIPGVNLGNSEVVTLACRSRKNYVDSIATTHSFSVLFHFCRETFCKQRWKSYCAQWKPPEHHYTTKWCYTVPLRCHCTGQTYF